MFRNFLQTQRSIFGPRSAKARAKRGRPNDLDRNRNRGRRLVMEALEQRRLLSATIATDLADYAPGATALITGSGFTPGGAVQLQVKHTDGKPDVSPANAPWTIVDNPDGTLNTSWYVDPASSAGAALELFATDLTTGQVATENFTDATITATSVTSSVTSGASLKVGATDTITVTFSQAVTLSSGTPKLQLNTSPTEYAAYQGTSGSGPTTFTFLYTVTAGDNTSRLDYPSTSAISGGTFKVNGITDTVRLPTVAGASDGVYNNNNSVDTTTTTVSSLTVTPTPTNVAPTINVGSITNSHYSIIAAEYFVDTAGTAGNGTALTVTGSSSPYSANGPLANFSNLSDGSHTVYVDAEDAAGNWSSQVNTTFIKDSQIPTVTVTGPAVTNQSPISFTATFSTPVNGLTASGITVTNGSVAQVTGSGTTYTIIVNPTSPSPQAGESVSVQVNAGATTSVNTNYNGVHDPNQASNTVSTTFDNVAPVLTATNLIPVNPATLPPGSIISPYASFQIQLVYNEPVIATSAVLHLNAATQTSVTGSGTDTLTFSFTPSTVASTRLDFVSSGVLTGTIADAAGNAAGLPTANDGLYNDNITVDGFSSQTSITPLNNTVPFTFQVNSSLPIAGLNGTGAGWTNGTGGTISNIQFTPGSSSFTFQFTPTSGTTASISLVAGNVYYNALPGAAYWCNSYSNTAAITAGDILPSVAVTSAPNANFNAPAPIAGTYSANGGAAVTQVQVELTPMNSGAYPASVYTAVLNNGNWSYTVPANTLASGSYSVFAIATNGTEIVSSSQTTLKIVDNAPPVTTAATYTKSGTRYYSASPNSNGWFGNNSVSTIYFQLSATDANTGNSNPVTTYYTIDGGAQQTYTAGSYISVTGNSQHTVTYWSVDGVGNIETAHNLPIWIDSTTPTATVNQPGNGTYGQPMTITGNWTAGPSGASITVSIYDYVDHYPYITIAQQSSTSLQNLPATINPNGTWSFTFTPTGAYYTTQVPVESVYWVAAVGVTSGASVSGTGASSDSPGNGLYTGAPSVSFSGGGGSGAAATANFVRINGGGFVTQVTVTNGGSGYTSPPTVTFGYNGAGNAVGTAVLDGGGHVIGVNVAGFTIGKANATIAVTPYSVTYDGNAHTATAVVTGVMGEALAGIDLSGTTHTNAGSYATDPWSFANPNYVSQNGTVDDEIAKANATIAVTPYSVTYDGNPHTATAVVTGVKGAALTGIDLSGTTHTNAGSYTLDPWSFANPNYVSQNGTVDDEIAKANATIAVTPYSVTYDGNPHTATVVATGVKGEALAGIDLSGTTHTDAGSYTTDPWSFANPNYVSQNGTVDDEIRQATASISVGYSGVYDSYAHALTGTATGVGGVTLPATDLVIIPNTYTNVADSGTVLNAWIFSDPNYQPASGSATVLITPATASVAVTPYSVTYDGNAHTATVVATGVGGVDLSGSVDLSGTTHTNAGSYTTDPWSFANANYVSQNGTVDDEIAKADATIVVTPYSVTYDGNAHTATVVATGVGGVDLSGSVDLSGTTHTNAGSYTTDGWTFTDATGNYNNTSGTADDEIAKTDAWIGGTAGNPYDWNVPSNWDANIDPNGVGITVVFGNAGATGKSILPTTNRTVGTIIFNSSTPTTIDSAGGTLTLDNGTSDAAINVSGSGHNITSAVSVLLNSNAVITVIGSTDSLAIAGNISDGGNGPKGITKNGLGTLILSGDNNYSGDTVVTGGVLELTSASALLDGSSLTVGDPSLFASPVVPAAPVATSAVSKADTAIAAATAAPAIHVAAPQCATQPAAAPVAKAHDAVLQSWSAGKSAANLSRLAAAYNLLNQNQSNRSAVGPAVDEAIIRYSK